MDKVIVDKAVGGDGAAVVVGIDQGSLAVEIKYPLAKVLSPVNDLVDKAFGAVEKAIPGPVDDAVLEPIKAGLKAEIAALIGSA
jgi:hypothetical protein